MMDFVPTMLDTPATLIDPLRTTLRRKLIEETVQKMQKKKPIGESRRYNTADDENIQNTRKTH